MKYLAESHFSRKFDRALHLADEPISQQGAIEFTSSRHPLESARAVKVDGRPYISPIGNLPGPLLKVGRPISEGELSISLILSSTVCPVVPGTPDLYLVGWFFRSFSTYAQTFRFEKGDEVTRFVSHDDRVKSRGEIDVLRLESDLLSGRSGLPYQADQSQK